MKGPGLRIELDVRRVWRCAKCGKSVRTPAHVVSQRCGCSEPGQWMRLERPVQREPFRPPPREPIPDDDDPASEALPGDPSAAAQAPMAGAAGEPREVEPEASAAEAVPQPAEPPGAVAAETETKPPDSNPVAPPPSDDFGAGVADRDG